ncbi:MAG: hypothetical protein IJ903_06930 [Ruminococcus sp.]|nr:hypothetical protein [Ruminococcus sp.]
MTKLKKSMSMLLALLMLISLFTAATVTTQAAQTSKSKTGGLFYCIVLEDDKEEMTFIRDSEVHNDAVEGVTFDEESNTLTLDNVDFLEKYSLNAYVRGDDFKLNIVGTCSLSAIHIYSGSLNIIGDGSLTVGNEVKFGITFEPYFADSYDSSLNIANSVSVKIWGKKSAFRIRNSSSSDTSAAFKADGKSLDNVTREEVVEPVSVKVPIGKESVWDDGIGYRYKVVKDDDPDGIYCARVYSETTVFGDDTYTENKFDLVKCYYDESSERTYIDYYIDELSEDEFNAQGYSLVPAEGVYAQLDKYQRMTCYQIDVSDDAEVYKDESGNIYAVKWGNVYTYDESETITFKDKTYYVYSNTSDISEDDLKAVTEDFTTYTYLYGDSEFVKEKSEETTSGEEPEPEETTAPVNGSTEPNTDTTQPVTNPAAETTAPGGDETQPSGEDSDALLWVGSVKVTKENAANITGDGLSGKISYDESTSTLTLSNATITTSHNYINNYYTGVYAEKNINIHLVGENTVKPEDNIEMLYSFANLRGEFKFTGGGKLDCYGIQANTITITKSAKITSFCSAFVGSYKGGIMAINLNIDGSLNADSVSLFEECPAVIAKNITVGSTGTLKATACNTVTISNGTPAQTKAVYINEGGSMTIDGTVSVEASGTYSGTQMNRGYGIYGYGQCKLIIGTSGKLTASGLCKAISDMTISLKSKNVTIKAGDDANSAKATELKKLSDQKYIFIQSKNASKKANTLTVSAKKKTIKAKKLLKKKQTAKPLTIKNAKGTLEVVKVKKGTTAKIFKKITVNKKTGAITFKKGKYSKKTYKVKLKITAAGNASYNAKTINKVVKVVVK